MNTGKPELITIAREYAEHGMVVVPAIDKKPFSNSWQKTTVDDVINSSAGWKYANGLNLVCGERSGITVVDVDIIEADNPALFKRVMDLLPPAPPVQRIGNPRKRPSRFYQYNGEKARKLNAIQVEILSDGNNCCMPPGWNHQSKTNFKWSSISLLDFEAENLPFIDPTIIEALDKLNEEIKDQEKDASGTGFKSQSKLEVGRCRHNSHNLISSYAVARRHAGYSPEQLVKDVIKYDARGNKDADKLYFECKTRKWTGKNIKENAESFITEVCKRNKLKPEFEKINEAYPSMKDGFYIQAKNKDGEPTDKWAPDYEGMSNFFKNNWHLKNDDSYRSIYRCGYYKPVTKLGLDNLVVKLMKKRANPTALRNFKAMITSNCVLDKELFRPGKGLINTANCVVNIDTRSTVAHSPEFNFMYKLPYKYEPDAKCPRFLEFLDYVFMGDKNLGLLIGEILGYTLVGGSPFKHKAFCFYGDGRNGKSTLLDVIIAVLGKESVSAVTMGNLDKPFSAIRLDGKLANIVEESPKNIDAEAFKNIVGGGYITAALKNMNEFDLKVNARLFFATNEFPHFKDNTTGLKERLEIIPFERFIPEGERDYGLKNKLLTEVPGILNFALDGWARLKGNDYKFTKSVKSTEAMREYVMESDSIARWLEETVKFTGEEEDYITNDELYNNYVTYCDKSKNFPKGNIPFIKKIRATYGAKCRNRRRITHEVWSDSLHKREIVMAQKNVTVGVRYAVSSDFDEETGLRVGTVQGWKF